MSKMNGYDERSGRSNGWLGRMARGLHLVCVVWLVCPAVAAGADPAGQRRVLLISCDGLRPDAIDLAEAPVMQGLISTGSYQSTCLNEMPPVTLPNHTSMVTGQSVLRHGVFANTTLPGRVGSTTIFDVASAAGLGVGFFVGKGKLAYLCEEETALAWQVGGDTDPLADEVVAAVGSEDLHLIFVHFGGPDGAGHQWEWMSDAYLAEVSRMDAAIGRILAALEGAGILDETVVIITADHGGHWNTHFLDIAEDRFIPFIVNGPGVAAGRRLCEQVRVMDVAATALSVLGLPTVSAEDGKVVREAWASFDQAECTAPEVHFTIVCGTLPPFFGVPLAAMMLGWGRRRVGWRLSKARGGCVCG